VVRLSISGDVQGNVIGADVGGKWVLKATSSLQDGTYTVSAHGIDAAGNEGTGSNPFSFKVDTKPPETKIIPNFSDPHNSPVVTFAFEGKGEDSDSIVTFVCTVKSLSRKKEVTDSCNALQQFDLAALFEIEDGDEVGVNGDYTIQVVARDEAGNVDATAEADDWTVIVKSPLSPEVLEPLHEALVYDLTPTISGKTIRSGEVELVLEWEATGEMGEVVLKKKEGFAKADEEGLWDFSFPDPLAQTSHRLMAKVTDGAKNKSRFSDPITFTVFEPKPVAHAIGGGFGCAAGGAEPWLALLGFVAGGVLSSRRRRR
jgi:uncharacterized protein (TIGR03382 family)